MTTLNKLKFINLNLNFIPSQLIFSNWKQNLIPVISIYHFGYMVYVIYSVLKIRLPHLDDQVYDTLVSGFPQKLKTVNLAYSPNTKRTYVT